MWPVFLMMARLQGGHSMPRAGDQKSSTTNNNYCERIKLRSSYSYLTVLNKQCNYYFYDNFDTV